VSIVEPCQYALYASGRYGTVKPLYLHRLQLHNLSYYIKYESKIRVLPSEKAREWQWKKGAGNEDFPSSGAATIRRAPQTDNTKPAHRALNELMLDWPRRKNSSRYSSWWTEVEVKMKAKGWQWKNDSGNEYDAFLLHSSRSPNG